MLQRTPYRPARSTPSRGLLGSLLVIATLLVAMAIPASAQSPVPTDDIAAQGVALVDRFLTILSEPDDQKRADLEGFLAPEFQLIRADGTRFDREAYIADPSSVTGYSIGDLVATGADGGIVTTYLLTATVTIDGVTRTTTAPRLSVFSQHRDEWLISAHANFSPLAPEADASPAASSEPG
jgi:hypothetical protein